MVAGDSSYLLPEQQARRRIDEMLQRAGWVVQDYKSVNLYEGTGVAVRELVTIAGPADYVLFVDRQAVGVIEAKKKGTTLSGVEWQTVKYQTNIPDELAAFLIEGKHLPYGYESTGSETWFTCRMDPEPTARRVFWFHRPETLQRQLDDHLHYRLGTLRARIPQLPALVHDPARLRDAQFEAVTNLERSFRHNHSRALIQMATGSGKTFAAANVCERLINHAQARRILFLVDRGNLGRQALKEFQGFEVPGSGRKFPELYSVQHLTHNRLDEVASVCIGTIQRVYSMLRGEAELDESLDEATGYELAPEPPVEVDYNPALPIEAFDVIIVDECHRSIYGVWRQVLEYFEAFLIGLTATPGKQTFGFFNGNLVMEYGFPRAVVDGVNVDFDVFPGSDLPWTKELWIYDLRTNKHFTLKTNTLTRADLDDFVACYQPGGRGKRQETERFHRFSYGDLVARDKASLDLFWLRDDSLEDTDNLPPPGVIAAEIVEDLQAALAEFTELAESLQGVGVEVETDE